MTYGERFEEALGYAARLHRAQMRKGTNIPYITHLLAVAAIVGENGGTEDEVIAALLHDAVEDQGGAATRGEIRGCADRDAVHLLERWAQDARSSGELASFPMKERTRARHPTIPHRAHLATVFRLAT